VTSVAVIVSLIKKSDYLIQICQLMAPHKAFRDLVIEASDQEGPRELDVELFEVLAGRNEDCCDADSNR
jgi:hypothetical protein